MTTKFTPFSGDQSLVITDTHGNELNIQTDPEQIIVYGQWQGKPDAPDFVSFMEMLKQVQTTLIQEKFIAITEQEGFNLSRKKGEVFLDVDLTLEKNQDSTNKLFKIINKVKNLKS